MLGMKSSGLRKKLAQSKANNEKLKHDTIVKETKEVVKNIAAQNEILKEDRSKNKIAVVVLEEELESLEKKIKKSEEKSKKAKSDIKTMADANEYAEKLKRGEI